MSAFWDTSLHCVVYDEYGGRQMSFANSNFLLNLRFKLNSYKTKTNLSPRPHEAVLESIYFPLNENEAKYFRSQ